MIKFKEYLKENEDLLAKINAELEELDEDEVQDFGEYLYYEFFDEEDTEEDDYDFFDKEDVTSMIKELGEDFYEDILDMLEEIEDEEESEIDEARGYNLEVVVSKAGEVQEFLRSDFRGVQKQEHTNSWVFKKERDLTDAVISLIDAGIIEVSDILDADIDLEDLEEGVSRLMKKKNMNKKKRKFMAKSNAEMRKTKTKRKQQARKDRAKRKRYARANKAKIKAYQKSRSLAIKKGKHKVKLRRKA